MRLIGIILLVGLFISSSAIEQKASEPQAKSESPTKQVSAPVEKLMEGMLVSLDKTKQSFVVKLKGKDYEFMVDGATVININGEKKGFEELSKGVAVRVNYVKDNKGVRIAKTIVQNIAQKKDKENKTQTSSGITEQKKAMSPEGQKCEVKQSDASTQASSKEGVTSQATQEKVEKKVAETQTQQAVEQKTSTQQQQPVQQPTTSQQVSPSQPTQKTVEQQKSGQDPHTQHTQQPTQQPAQPK